MANLSRNEVYGKMLGGFQSLPEDWKVKMKYEPEPRELESKDDLGTVWLQRDPGTATTTTTPLQASL